jgi:hypothetical protein
MTVEVEVGAGVAVHAGYDAAAAATVGVEEGAVGHGREHRQRCEVPPLMVVEADEDTRPLRGVVEALDCSILFESPAVAVFQHHWWQVLRVVGVGVGHASRFVAAVR